MEMRNSDFKIRMKEGTIKDYEKIVLSSGMCDLFMPMGFINNQGESIVSYDCSGYTALSQCSTLQVREALDILEKTFLILSRAGEYLITPSKITLTKDTIFYHEENHTVKIAYVPMEKQFLSVRENMMDFIVEVEQDVEKTDRKYLKKVREHLDHNNYYIRDIISLIGELKRVYFAGVQQTEEGESAE